MHRSSSFFFCLGRDSRHHGLLDAEAGARLITWLDRYGQRLGSFREAQERELTGLRCRMDRMVEHVGGH